MANFEDHDINQMITQIEKLSNKDEVYQSMISAGQEILQEAIKTGAERHKLTGKMLDGIYSTKPVKNAQGDWVGRVKFRGSNGVYKTKDGKKYDITNWLKAFRIEYGTSKQPAAPFLRPAVVSSEAKISKRMEEIYNQTLEGLEK